MDGRAVPTLQELAGTLSGAALPRDAARIEVRGVAYDARRIAPGELFVAIRGTAADGHSFIREAAARGACAAVLEREADAGGLPVVRVPDSRVALAELAAAWWGRPAERLRLVGITGSQGKTSVLSMLGAILETAGVAAGTIGSLGIRFDGGFEASRLTTPDAPTIQRVLATMARRRVELVAMEVTSHALDQARVHGLVYALGVFTNLALLEHLEYHGTFRRYAEAKARFLDQVTPGGPVVYRAGDRAVRSLLRGRDLLPIGCGPGGRVSFRVERLLIDRGGTRVRLTSRRPLPRVAGAPLGPTEIPIELRVLGKPNIANAALAATAALCLGADGEAIREALAAFPPPWRRMQMVHRGRFTVIDDTVGHPDSVSAVFEVAEKLRHRRLLVVYAIRGRRGTEINRRDAEAVAIWSRRAPLDGLLVTSSEKETDEANRVAGSEREAFLSSLDRYRVGYEHYADLAEAIDAVVRRAGDGDLVLLLGAQGMDRGAELLRGYLG